MIEEGLEVAAAVVAAVEEATSLWNQYKAGTLTKADVLAALAKDQVRIVAARAGEDAEIAALPSTPK